MPMLFAFAGAIVGLGYARWEEFQDTNETQRRLEVFVIEYDTAATIYSMQLKSTSPDVWLVSFRNRHGINLLNYIVEKDTIIRQDSLKLYSYQDIEKLLREQGWRLGPSFLR
jgi:hypothetical protein